MPAARVAWRELALMFPMRPAHRSGEAAPLVTEEFTPEAVMGEVGASGPHPSSTRAKRGSAARHSASGSPSSRRTMLAPRTIETIL